jgi:hypothetical protein
LVHRCWLVRTDFAIVGRRINHEWKHGSDWDCAPLFKRMLLTCVHVSHSTQPLRALLALLSFPAFLSPFLDQIILRKRVTC